MTIRQKILQLFYPILMKFSSAKAKKKQVVETARQPVESFYSLSVTLNSGQQLSFNTLKGKKVLLVNTASDCGYTSQYAELQNLYERHSGEIEIIGFPANDFKQQEQGNDAAIAEFCQVNFGVRFPLAKKSIVVSSANQNPVFMWLTDKAKNGWNMQQPSWNFSKFLVNEHGILTHYFEPSISPLSKEIIQAIQS
jgi:glutathione peroxidase